MITTICDTDRDVFGGRQFPMWPPPAVHGTVFMLPSAATAASSCCCMGEPAVRLTCTQWAACSTTWPRDDAHLQVSAKVQSPQHLKLLRRCLCCINTQQHSCNSQVLVYVCCSLLLCLPLCTYVIFVPGGSLHCGPGNTRNATHCSLLLADMHTDCICCCVAAVLQTYLRPSLELR
jgi:hypothetical protein